MNPKEIERATKLSVLETWVSSCKNTNKTLDVLHSTLGLSPESPICEVVYKLMEDYTKVVSDMVKDEDGFVEWFLYDTQLGEHPMECEIRGTKYLVSDANTLLTVIETI